MQEVANLQGLVVIDVVEGTAISSLPHMVNVLRQRPSSFTSLQDAVHWARKSGEETKRLQDSCHTTYVHVTDNLHFASAHAN